MGLTWIRAFGHLASFLARVIDACPGARIAKRKLWEFVRSRLEAPRFVDALQLWNEVMLLLEA